MVLRILMILQVHVIMVIYYHRLYRLRYFLSPIILATLRRTHLRRLARELSPIHDFLLWIRLNYPEHFHIRTNLLNFGARLRPIHILLDWEDYSLPLRFLAFECHSF